MILDNIKNTLTVNYNNKACYDIYFSNSFNDLPKQLNHINIKEKKICIVTDSNVGPLYAEEIANILSKYCKKVITFTFTAGETQKNLDTISALYQFLIENKFDRKDLLVALGGGVTGDMTGFTAATYLRGIDFIQIPTSLLAQADSSIGGKTGVDFKAYKNMVGAFYMPKLVYMNLNTLKTLPNRDFYSGLSEIIKHGIIKDSDLFYWLKHNNEKILNRDYESLKIMLFNSCMVKKEVVEKDPTEKGERALLNFGHTIGHAVEKIKDFSLYHGECVSIGMCSAAYISLLKNKISENTYNEILDCLEAFNLPITTSNIDVKEVVAATFNDKKMEAGKIKFILIESIGNAVIDTNISNEELEKGTISIIEG